MNEKREYRMRSPEEIRHLKDQIRDLWHADPEHVFIEDIAHLLGIPYGTAQTYIHQMRQDGEL